VEDYEYFVLLKELVERATAMLKEVKGDPVNGLGFHDIGELRLVLSTQGLTEARELLTLPRSISADTTHFTTDVRPLLERREKIARMIEKLQKALGK
jgi:hypothetical protein